MSKKGRGFFDLGWLVSFIIALFWIGWIFGTLERFKRGNILGGIVNLLGYGFGILWICDLVTLITKHDITVLA